MRRSAILVLLTLTAAVHAQTPASPRTHRLEATPSTVAYGYYWSEAKPVLRIASGDIIDVDTLLTNTPSGLAARRRHAGRDPGVAAERSSTEVTGDTGPGGHILTGPVFVEGAEPGDALEVKVLSIDLPIDYGYNGCSGFLPRELRAGRDRAKIIPLDRSDDDRDVRAWHRHSAQAVLRQHGRGAARRSSVASAAIRRARHAGNLDNRELVAGTHAVHSGAS